MGAVRQQAITGTSDQVLWCHRVSIDLNEPVNIWDPFQKLVLLLQFYIPMIQSYHNVAFVAVYSSAAGVHVNLRRKLVIDFRVRTIAICSWFTIFELSTPGARLTKAHDVKDIVTHTQKTVKCIFLVYGFKILCEISKGTFEISHKILNPYTAKICILRGVKNLTTYDILELWHLKS